MGGYKVQGKTLNAIEQLMRDAVALDRAGVACIYLEGIPREVAAMITAEVEAPTIGIGAGPDCDGQVLVFHDLVNLTFGHAGEIRSPLRRRRRADHRNPYWPSRPTWFRTSSRTTPSPTTCRKKRRPHSKRYSTASTPCGDNGGRRKRCAKYSAKTQCESDSVDSALFCWGSGRLLQASAAAEPTETRHRPVSSPFPHAGSRQNIRRSAI